MGEREREKERGKGNGEGKKRIFEVSGKVVGSVGEGMVFGTWVVIDIVNRGEWHLVTRVISKRGVV